MAASPIGGEAVDWGPFRENIPQSRGNSIQSINSKMEGKAFHAKKPNFFLPKSQIESALTLRNRPLCQSPPNMQIHFHNRKKESFLLSLSAGIPPPPPPLRATGQANLFLGEMPTTLLLLFFLTWRERGHLRS